MMKQRFPICARQSVNVRTAELMVGLLNFGRQTRTIKHVVTVEEGRDFDAWCKEIDGFLVETRLLLICVRFQSTLITARRIITITIKVRLAARFHLGAIKNHSLAVTFGRWQTVFGPETWFAYRTQITRLSCLCRVSLQMVDAVINAICESVLPAHLGLRAMNGRTSEDPFGQLGNALVVVRYCRCRYGMKWRRHLPLQGRCSNGPTSNDVYRKVISNAATT